MSTEERIIGEPFQDGDRIDRLLPQLFPDYSRSFFKKCIAAERVLINGKPCVQSTKTRAGDTVTVDFPPEEDETARPEDIPLDVLYEDDAILVINKPAGLVVHPANGNATGTLVQALLFREQDTFSEMMDETQRPGIVHRLDKDTSGTLIVAKDTAAQTTLKAAFMNHQTQKTYLAIVQGVMNTPQGKVEKDIGRHPVNRIKRAVVTEGGKRAITHYRLLGTGGGCSLLEVHILTGRTHQIRVHLASLHHPVLGDALYGGHSFNGPCAVPRQMLHAWTLTLPHPVTRASMTFTAPIPQDFRDTLTAMGLPCPEAPLGDPFPSPSGFGFHD